MPGNVLPVFDHIEDNELAAAASEPFLRRDDYEFISSQPVEADVQPLAVGVSYISEDRVAYGFTVSNTTETPLHVTDLFFTTYDLCIGVLQKRINTMLKMVPDTDKVYARNARKLIEKTKASELKVIAGFALLQTVQQPGFGGTLIVCKKAADEMPLETRERQIPLMGNPLREVLVRDVFGERISDAAASLANYDKDVLTNEIAKRHIDVGQGASRVLPRLADAKKQASSDPRIGNFYEQPRKVRRAKLKQELKQARR